MLGVGRFMRVAVRLLLAHVFVLMSGALVAAQTVVDPTLAEFAPSPDHTALHSDGRRLVVRTYVALYFFRLDDAGIPRPEGRRGCAILGLELQGEGVTWLDDETLALSSESAYGVPGTISRVRCRLP